MPRLPTTGREGHSLCAKFSNLAQKGSVLLEFTLVVFLFPFPNKMYDALMKGSLICGVSAAMGRILFLSFITVCRYYGRCCNIRCKQPNIHFFAGDIIARNWENEWEISERGHCYTWKWILDPLAGPRNMWQYWVEALWRLDWYLLLDTIDSRCAFSRKHW